MKVAITGATGHVGANVVRALLGEGWSVRALVRQDVRALDGLDVQQVPGDVEDVESLRTLFEGAELAFHLAGHITLDPREAARAYEVNVEGTRNVTDACLGAGVRRLVHFSSIHAFDDRCVGRPIDEERGSMVDPSRPRYGLSKAAGEKVVQDAIGRGLDAVIVNPTGVIGPHDYKGSRMGRVLTNLASGAMPIVPNAGYDWVDARDVAEGAKAAALRGRTGQRYILSGNWASLAGLGLQVDEALGQQRRRLTVPLWTAWIGVPFASVASLCTGRTAQCTTDSIKVLYGESRVSSALAAAELGFKARPLGTTLADTLAWHQGREVARVVGWPSSQEATR